MSRTVTAYYDSRSAADTARERLRAGGFDSAHVLDQSSEGYDGSTYSTREKPGIWASIKNALLPDEDRHHYEEGIRRGGAVVSVDVDHDAVPRVVEILENDAVDLDTRANTWRDSGWTYPEGGRSPAAAASAAAAARVDMGRDRSADRVVEGGTHGMSGHRSPDYDMDGTPDYGHAEGENTMDTPSPRPNGPYATRENHAAGVRSYFESDYATEPGYAHGGRTGTSLAEGDERRS
jgi:hypothetical protein